MPSPRISAVVEASGRRGIPSRWLRYQLSHWAGVGLEQYRGLWPWTMIQGASVRLAFASFRSFSGI